MDDITKYLAVQMRDIKFLWVLEAKQLVGNLSLEIYMETTSDLHTSNL